MAHPFRHYNRLSADNLELNGTALTSSAAELNIMDGVTATAAEINNAVDVSARFVAAGSTLAVTAALHSGKIIKLDTVTGSVCTLPAATGTGNIYRFVTSVLATSNSHIVKVTTTDVFAGAVVTADNADGTATAFGTQATSDTITLNRTTMGSVVKAGDYLEFIDVATGFWHVSGFLVATGTEANPFSATV